MNDSLPAISDLALVPTLACNLACRHCPVLRGPAATPLATAFEAIDRVAAGAGPSMWLGFAGGEPFLAPDFVLACSRRAAARCRAAGRRLALAATTNGTCLPPAILDQLGELGFNLSISIDGPPEIQAASRGELAAAAWESLARALATPGIEVAGTITMTPLTAPHLARTVAALVDAGVTEIDLTPDAGAGWDESSLAALAAGLRAAASDCRRRSREPWPLTFMRPLPAGTGPMVCGAARRTLAVAPDGGVYGCPQLLPIRRWRGLPAPSPVFDFYRLGTVADIGTPEFECARSLAAGGTLAIPLDQRRSGRRACADCRFRARCRPCPAVSIDLGLAGGLIPDSLCSIFYIQMTLLAELGCL